MEFIGDFHIHSGYAGACSKDITLEKLEEYAKIKGVNVLGTGDFQHPKWNIELNKKLEEDENGILWSKNKFPFIWQSELSLVYTQDGKGRRVHHLVLAPNKGVVDQIIDEFKKRWRIDYDGRPILGVSSIDFTELLKGISKDIEIIPAHAWTSWFGVLGSKGGFNSIEECFKDQAKHIHAIETGMSSDPEMNRRISSLDKYAMVSFSDMHSFWPWRIGREATIFDCKLNYKDIIKSIREKKLKATIEVDPCYGKYHEDGHRVCDIHFTPKQTREQKGICPKCKKPLTIGVEYRVEELTDREKAKNVEDYHKVVPLSELIASVHGIKQVGSKKVWSIFNDLIKNFKTEFDILLRTPEKELLKVVKPKLVSVIIENRNGHLNIDPGYDGVYGKIILKNKEKISNQKGLDEF